MHKSLEKEMETAGLLAEVMHAAALVLAQRLQVRPTPGRLALAALLVATREARRAQMPERVWKRLVRHLRELLPTAAGPTAR